MATITPKNGIVYAWNPDTENFADEMDANLIKISVLISLSVIDRNLATPPGSPSNGDTYIVAASGTDAWAGQDNNIAYWNATEWIFYTPEIGQSAYIVDEDVRSTYKSTGWSAGVTA